jgi:hypothetical protein
MKLCHWVNGDRLALFASNCQPIWSDWAWLWLYVLVDLGSYRYCGCDRLGCKAYRLCCSVSFVCSRSEFGACSTGIQTLKNGNQEFRFSKTELWSPPSVPWSHNKFQSNHFGTYQRCNTVIHLNWPPFEATIIGDYFILLLGQGVVQYFLSRNMEMGQAKFVFPTQCVSNCVLKFWTPWRGKLPELQRVIKKLSVYLMITIQKDTSNVQSVPRQSPDVYMTRLTTWLNLTAWQPTARARGTLDSQ